MLIIALVFITVFAVLITGILTFADVGMRSSRAFGIRGLATYGQDGAVQNAIYRYGNGGACENVDSPLDPAGNPVDGRRYTVSCNGPPPGGDRANKPVNALLSLGSVPGEEGVETTRPMRVLGSVFSNSTVKAGASLVVQGSVSALGNCDPAPPSTVIQTDPADDVHCANVSPPADPSRGRDPDYLPATTTVPLHRDVPACPSSGWLVTLDPGAYDDAAGLSALTTTCPNAVVLFNPGFYYFDFTFRGGSATWTVGDPTVDVVGGQPKGTWAANPSGPRPTASQLRIPGACKTETDGLAVKGVQFAFGGDSHLQIDRGRVELCATPGGQSDQSIALYGMAPTKPSHTLDPTAIETNVGFANPGNAVVTDELPVLAADAPLTPGSPAQLVVKAFRPGVPAGALIDSAFLRVRHQELGDPLTLQATVGGCTTTLPSSPQPPGPPAYTTGGVDLKAACAINDAGQFTDMTVRIDANLDTGGASAHELLDGVYLDVAYRIPTVMRATAASATVFAPAAKALEIDGGSTTGSAAAALFNAVPTASLTVSGLGDPPIPPGSTIDSARLRVVHQETGNLAPPKVTVGPCVDQTVPLSPTSFADYRLDLMACGLTDADQLKGLTATFTATTAGGPGGTALLDGMWLELVYVPPALTRQATTVTPTPAGSFSNPDPNAKAIGEQPTVLTSNATLDATTLPSASLAFTAFDLPVIPPGSYVDSAILRLAHQEQEANVGDIAVNVTIPVPAGTCTVPLGVRSAMGTDGILLKQACSLTNDDLLATLATLAVSYNATLVNLAPGTTGPVSVDGLVLDLAYRPPATRRATAATPVGPGFTTAGNNAANALAIDNVTADAPLGSSTAAVASLDLNGFGDLPIPAGSLIDSARLKVAHQEDAGIAGVAVTSTFAGNTCPGPTAVPLHTTPPGPTLPTDTFDLKACGFNELTGPASLAVRYTASLPPPTSATQVPSSSVVSAADGCLPSGGTSCWATPDGGRQIGDGTVAVASLATGFVESATITLSGYPTDLPAGSYVDSAILRVAHQDSDPGPITALASFTGSSCTAQTLSPQLGSTPGTDEINLRACGFTDPALLASLSVKYTVGLAGTAATHRLDGVELVIGYRRPATDHLDGVELELVYRPPAMRPLGGCLTATPYPSVPPPVPPAVTPCALVKVTSAGSDLPRLAVGGTVYAPSAALDIDMRQVTAEMFTRGLVARTIRIGVEPAPTYQRATVGKPPEAVTFTAYPYRTLQPDNASSTAGAGMAAFANPDGAKAPGGAQATATLDATLTSAKLDVDWANAPLAPPNVDALVLRVAHREDPAVSSVVVEVRNQTTTCQTAVLSPHPVATPVVDQIALKLAACGTDPSQLSVSVTVALGASPPAGTFTAAVDAVTLDLLSSPELRAKVEFDRGKAIVKAWNACTAVSPCNVVP